MRWSPRKVSSTKGSANATSKLYPVQDSTQANGNIAIVPLSKETHQPGISRHLEVSVRQDEFLSEECILETQNSTQSRSQPLDVITFLANMMEGDRDDISPTPTFKHPRIGEACSTNEGRSTSILKHIGCTYDDDQEVFVDALDDRPTPVSPTPLKLERAMCSSHQRPLSKDRGTPQKLERIAAIYRPQAFGV